MEGFLGLLGAALDVLKGVSGVLSELLGQPKSIEKRLVFIAFSQYGPQGVASEKALGPFGGRGGVPRDLRVS